MRFRKRLLFLVVLAIASFVVYKVYRDPVMEFVQKVAIELRAQPVLGSMALSIMVMATSVPPLLGFTFASSLCGFVYGFPGGIAPAVVGAFLGSMVCFGLIRHFNFARFIRLSPDKQLKYQAIQEAIQESGFGMIVLIRITPIPWEVTNTVLSMLPSISTKKYALSAFLASWKVALEVWFGSQLASLSDPDLPPSAHRVTLITLGVGFLIILALAVYLHRVTMRKIRDMQENEQLNKDNAPPQVMVVPSADEEETRWLLQ
ncbi:hypothetical protein BDB00DRAFT_877697 [Zychaea mexicana]|uniref:uncharacterized protein n=1 Tax=Zychaea mexicana TaxID=64656 RepID=UPI0022FE9610|nr:uncharacterized protein BDB00DRAFT_877697 [Zychaea mexicana]KAI9488227.1 hypothetical protein BDB00DRAFT_877697 [Zychaea mexicana]